MGLEGSVISETPQDPGLEDEVFVPQTQATSTMLQPTPTPKQLLNWPELATSLTVTARLPLLP